MNNWLLTAISIFGLACFTTTHAQIVHIPDANFKAALVNDTSINTNGDSEIQVAEASVYSGSINVWNRSISDLTGIEAFTAIIWLDCSNNPITVLDVSKNTDLTNLWCADNQLTSLDISYNKSLSLLNCEENKLTDLDVSQNTALTVLSCKDNQLTRLNVKNGNNLNIVLFYALNNLNLTCIQVDDTAWSKKNWFWVDETASFSENCGYTSINDFNGSSALTIYPNPTQGKLFLSAHSNIVLTDLTGKVILKKLNTNQIDISELPKGLYFLSVGDNLKKTFKVVKE
jgi:hypothetical protein